MKTNEAKNKDLALQLLIKERDRLLRSCNYQVDTENKPLYDLLTDQIARIAREIFELKLAQSISMIESSHDLKGEIEQ